ncbi:MAG: epoxyqueuosine reductase QueH [Eubacteriales bacterium]|nr:epoxyqueuosine reductase QueH [Eubacteriales bacterium]
MNENILLHACCGPCAEYPLDVLIHEEGLRPLLFFYNPNIHPRVEWQRRRDNLQKLADLRGLNVLVETDYAENEWVNYDPALHGGLSRCQMCYETRLDRTAAKAKELGLPSFTSTLLVSPYQDYDELVRQGLAAAERYGVEFLVRDFRTGFRSGQTQAREDGLYRQKYCGCRPSLEQSDFREKILKGQAAWLAEQEGKPL